MQIGFEKKKFLNFGKSLLSEEGIFSDDYFLFSDQLGNIER